MQKFEFVHPDWNWDVIHADLENTASDVEAYAKWNMYVKKWLHLVRTVMPEGYAVHESTNFLVLCPSDGRLHELVVDYCEHCFEVIARLLPVSEAVSGREQIAIVVLLNWDHYKSYVHSFYPDNDVTPPPTGCLIDIGCKHIAIPVQDFSLSEGVIAHELAYAFISTLDLSLWLEEGIATLVEESATGRQAIDYAPVLPEYMHNHSNDSVVARFLNGDLFYDGEDELKYARSLAYFVLRSIIKECGSIEDAIKYIGDCSDESLNQLIEVFVSSLSPDS